jgi:nitrate/nitrite transporter NarK
MVSSWFKGKELAFAFGLNLSISRLGSVINAAVVPAVYDSNGLGAALLVGFSLACVSLALSFGMAFLDQKAEERAQVTDSLDGRERHGCGGIKT